MPNLDVLRSLAVLLVLADHGLASYGSVFAHSFHPYDWYLGRVGVLFFFVHTCRVLMASLARTEADGAELVREFYLRRAFRIYPLAIVCVLVVVLLGVPRVPWEQFTPWGAGTVAANLSLTMNLAGSKPVLAPLWSLPVEVQMYLVLPFIFLLTRRATDLGRIGMVLGLALVVSWALPAISGRLYGASFAPCFVAGIVAYALRDRIAPRLPAMLWPVFLLAAVLAYAGIEEMLEGVVHFALQDALCLAVAVALPLFRQSTSATLNRATHLLARYSYGVYLFHCIALWIGIFWIRPQSFWIGALLAMVLLVALAVGSYHLIEAPAIRRGAGIVRSLEAERA